MRMAGVRPARNGTAVTVESEVNSAVCQVARPSGPITALMPDVAATRAVRPLATAWTLVMASCCSG